MKAIVFDIKRCSQDDGPAIRTTVFFKGCNLDCFWCHNPEGRSPKKQYALFKDKCIGCGKCAKNCPADAISRTDYIAPGHKLASFAIDTVKCVKCGACISNCKFDAISKK